MRFLVFLGALGAAGFVSAFPQSKGKGSGAGTQATGSIAGFLSTLDFKNSKSNALDGPCKKTLLIVARGSGEPGNIVRRLASPPKASAINTF
jgi:hypothetical protein